MNQTLFVMQGPPGAGKTTLAMTMARSAAFGSRVAVCAADDFHINPTTGAYEWKAENVKVAHNWNAERIAGYLDHGYTVWCDCTNIRQWEAGKYVKLAVERGVNVVFIRCEGGFQNTHGVPAEKVERMRSRLEPLSVSQCLEAAAAWAERDRKREEAKAALLPPNFSASP